MCLTDMSIEMDVIIILFFQYTAYICLEDQKMSIRPSEFRVLFLDWQIQMFLIALNMALLATDHPMFTVHKQSIETVI